MEMEKYTFDLPLPEIDKLMQMHSKTRGTGLLLQFQKDDDGVRLYVTGSVGRMIYLDNPVVLKPIGTGDTVDGDESKL